MPSSEELASNPSTLPGMMPVRKSVQVPWVSDAAAPAASTDALLPGLVSSPSVMPIVTEMRAVMANHCSVLTASRAAFATWASPAMLATIAVKTRGGTAVRSSVTNAEPMVVSVLVSQLGAGPSAVPTCPISRATRPSATPRTSEMRIWTPKGVRLSVVSMVLLQGERADGGLSTGGQRRQAALACSRRSTCRRSVRPQGLLTRGTSTPNRCLFPVQGPDLAQH